MSEEVSYTTRSARLSVTLHVPPCPAPRMTKADAWKNRPCVLRYRAFRDQVRIEAMRVGYTLGAAVRVTFYLPMPPSWSIKKRHTMVGTPHQQRPDIDNLTKAFLDAMESEDGFVWSIQAEKRWASAGEIRIEAVRQG